MDTDILYEFTELAKRLNFTETARTLNMSQPTLSKHISSLEKELRLALFDRSSANLRLTRAGTDLLSSAYKVTESVSEFLDKAKSLRSAPPPHLSVGGFVNEDIVIEALGRIVSNLYPVYGSNFLEAKSCNHHTPRELLEDKTIDIIFDYGTEEDYSDELTEVTLVGKVPWVAVVGKNHRLASRTSITLDDLKTETIIKVEGAHVTDGWRFIERAFRERSLSPNVRKHYSMKLTDLVTTVFNIGNDVLILGTNFIQRIGIGINSFCTQIPIVDEDAYFPVAAIYRTDNGNPILAEALESLKPANP